MLILLISAWKSYFCDNDAIYDVIMQEPVRKWRHNHRLKISRDSFSELPLFKTFAIIFIFRQIDRANFAVRGSSSLRRRHKGMQTLTWTHLLLSLNYGYQLKHPLSIHHRIIRFPIWMKPSDSALAVALSKLRHYVECD